MDFYRQMVRNCHEWGINIPAELEAVQLEFSSSIVQHLDALPLHPSQFIRRNILTLNVIINRELQNKIMSYGEHVRVLAPSALAEEIRKRHKKAFKKY